jgi:hypothetical protein
MNTVQSKWEEFAKEVVPEEACEIQHRDMRMSFFSGFTTCFNMLETTLKELSVPAAEAVKLSLREECLEFTLEILNSCDRGEG